MRGDAPGRERIGRAWIEPGALRTMLDAYAAAAGREPCGLLLGSVEGGVAHLREVIVLANVHPTPDRAFRIPAEEHLRIAREARDRDLAVVGYWHGHLVGAAVPGRADREGLDAIRVAAGHGAPRSPVLVIVGRTSGPAAAARAWVTSRRGAREIPLAV